MLGLRKWGVFVVECGELERFVRLVGEDSKKEWLDKVLPLVAVNDRRLQSAQQFVRDLIAWQAPVIVPPPAEANETA